MKKLLVAIVWVFLFGASALSVTYNSNPKIFISELISDAMKTINDKSISTEDKTKFLEKIALENVDIKALGMYTLGDIRKTLDPETLKEYNKLFEKYFLKSLTSRLIDYKTTKLLAKIKEIKEFNIGHFIIGESIFFGLKKVIKNFKKIIRNY